MSRHLTSALIAAGMVLCSLPSSAYTVLGGEIRYAWTQQGLIYEITAHIYTDLTNPVDLPSITISMGDGNSVEVPRDGIIDGFSASCGDVRLSTYTTTHQYAGPGLYIVQFDLPSRDAGVINIPDPANQGMCVQANLIISPVVGNNASVRFDTALVETHRVWNTLVHNVGAFDANGDSLSFELVTPLDEDCQAIAGYQLPPAANLLWLDPATGTLLWDYPPQAGLWSVAIQCTEWRNGYVVGQVTRDMSICIGSFQVGLGTEPGTAPLQLVPTLVDDLLTITVPQAGSRDLEIIDAAGTVCWRTSYAADNTTIDVSTLPGGLYAVRFMGARGPTSIARFVKR